MSKTTNKKEAYEKKKVAPSLTPAEWKKLRITDAEFKKLRVGMKKLCRFITNYKARKNPKGEKKNGSKQESSG